MVKGNKVEAEDEERQDERHRGLVFVRVKGNGAVLSIIQTYNTQSITLLPAVLQGSVLRGR